MKRIIKLLIPIGFIIGISSFFLSMTLGIILTILESVLCLLFIIFLILNKMIKQTNWWNNQFQGIEQFVSNSGYRNNHIRNYDIINLGSNPARYAFFYEGIKGQSWATGSQGQDMDLEILKYYHSYIKQDGIVLIPIMPFTAIAPYIKERSEYWGLSYYSKFTKILSYSQCNKLPNILDIYRYIRYPLLYNPKAIYFIFCDQPKDNRFHITEQPMMHMDLLQDAKHWIELWKDEFKLQNLNDVFDKKWSNYYDEAIELNKKIVDFCIERNLKPIFICVPMTKYLSDLIPEDVRQYLVTDFIKACNIHNLPFFDYTLDVQFQDVSLYFNSFFLNLKGRKVFTKRVLADLNKNNVIKVF